MAPTTSTSLPFQSPMTAPSTYGQPFDVPTVPWSPFQDPQRVSYRSDVVYYNQILRHIAADAIQNPLGIYCDHEAQTTSSSDYYGVTSSNLANNGFLVASPEGPVGIFQSSTHSTAIGSNLPTPVTPHAPTACMAFATPPSTTSANEPITLLAYGPWAYLSPMSFPDQAGNCLLEAFNHDRTIPLNFAMPNNYILSAQQSNMEAAPQGHTQSFELEGNDMRHQPLQIANEPTEHTLAARQGLSPQPQPRPQEVILPATPIGEHESGLLPASVAPKSRGRKRMRPTFPLLAPNPQKQPKIKRRGQPEDRAVSPGHKRQCSLDALLSPTTELTPEDQWILQLKEDPELTWKDIQARFENERGEVVNVEALQMRCHRARLKLRSWTMGDLRALQKAHQHFETKRFEFIADMMKEFGATRRWEPKQCREKWDEMRAMEHAQDAWRFSEEN